MDHLNAHDILERYAAGYFPMYDVPKEQGGTGAFFWDRWPMRAVLPVNPETVVRARCMARSAEKHACGKIEIRHTTAVEEVIAQLRVVRENSWVQERVVEIYRTLHAAGLLQTVEAWAAGAATNGQDDEEKVDGSARLVGALLGIVLPGTFVAETMYGIVPEASKLCLCRLVEACAADGFEMIDVQTPHDSDENGDPLPRAGNATAHPCIRLGEVQMGVREFLRQFAAVWERHFDGDIDAWLARAGAPRGEEAFAPHDPRRFLRHAALPGR